VHNNKSIKTVFMGRVEKNFKNLKLIAELDWLETLEIEISMLER